MGVLYIFGSFLSLGLGSLTEAAVKMIKCNGVCLMLVRDRFWKAREAVVSAGWG